MLLCGLSYNAEAAARVVQGIISMTIYIVFDYITTWGMTFILEWCVVMTLDSNWPLYILINSVSLTIQGPTRNRLERGRLAFD